MHELLTFCVGTSGGPRCIGTSVHSDRRSTGALCGTLCWRAKGSADRTDGLGMAGPLQKAAGVDGVFELNAPAVAWSKEKLR